MAIIEKSSATISPKSSQSAEAPIYLDNHATTPVDPVVLSTMLPFLQENFGNPASSHIFGVKAKFAVEQARSQVAAAINARPDEVLFTAGATESNNFALKGVADYAVSMGKTPHIITTNIEHKCILEAVRHLEKQGVDITILPVDSQGLISAADLQAAIKPTTVLVSVMFANNEIGTINPIAELAKIAHDHNALFHTDAAQAIGKVPVDVQELGIDILSASGHKFYGPKGIGFIYISQNAQQSMSPLLDGGGQEAHLRSGTLNVPGIVGIGKAIEMATADLAASIEHYFSLRNRLFDLLQESFPDLILNGTDIIPELNTDDTESSVKNLQRLPHNLNISLPSVDPALLGRIYSVAFSSTSACSSGSVEPSYVLQAIGRSSDEATASLRFGIGRFNTEEEVDAAADIISKALKTS